LLMSAAMMLNHLGEARHDADCKVASQRIKTAYNRALEENQKTRDLCGELGTREFAEAIIARLPQD
ncbi:MAG TPA: hypothetical protein VM686_07395, partial [Polyangiaceae bacterium]|nr:hypothetical protein [Polyangiaceae bacterium]